MTEEGIFLGGGDMAGMFVDASAPNITGIFGKQATQYANSYNYTDGCFNYKVYNDSTIGDGASNNGIRVSFDASRSSTIYGKSNKLYPDHYTVDWYIKYK